MAQSKFDPAKLDFNSIKSKLKEYFENSGEFTDYDFEGSGLSSLLDVLAYNTHIQGLVANFATNEAFLDTAQLRSSVVSHAKPLDYLPRSRRSSRAVVNLALSSVPSNTKDIVIPRYTKFSTSIDGKTYTFYTLDEYVAKQENGYTVQASIYEGKLLNKRFIVDSDQGDYPIYVIPDSNLDTSTLNVQVQQGLNSLQRESYSLPTTIGQLKPENNNYFIYESPNGYYEIMLGDGLIGKKPSEGSVIDIKYLKSSADGANNAKTFSTAAVVQGFNLSATTVTKALGGSERESIESIRFNAPKAFAAQKRAVTVDDYKTFIQQEAGYIETLNVWGGEDNIPPEYGVVFIAIKPTGRDKITKTEEVQLREVTLESRNVLTIEPVFVDPEFQFLEIKMNVRYEPNRTTLTKAQLENKVKNSILEYGVTNLSAFDSTFRRSRLLSFIDDSDDAVVSVDADVFMQRRLIPQLGVKARYDLAFSRPFAQLSSFDHILTSDAFEYTINGVTYTCSLRNKKGSTKLEIIRSGESGEIIVADDAGFIDTTNNIVTLLPFEPSGIINTSEGIRFSVRPSDENTIYPKRNLLIRIDERNTAVNAERDIDVG